MVDTPDDSVNCLDDLSRMSDNIPDAEIYSDGKVNRSDLEFDEAAINISTAIEKIIIYENTLFRLQDRISHGFAQNHQEILDQMLNWKSLLEARIKN